MRVLPMFIAVVVALAMPQPSFAAPDQSAEELMAAGDVFDRTFQSAKALEFYLPAVKLEPKSVPLLLRIARQYRDLLTEAPKGKEKLRLGNLSLIYAQRAAILAPDNSEAQLSPAISYGKMAAYMSDRDQLDALGRIKIAVDKAIKLDPDNDYAWHVLGRWHQGLANVSAVERAVGGFLYGKLPVTTNEEAVACFKMAIDLEPGRLRHHIELGCTYALMGHDAEARTMIERGLAMPDREKDDPEEKLRGSEALLKLR